MALNPQQIFANHILQKVLPAAQGSAVASNLEWNAKKFLGQVPGETLDAATYAERTKADLAQLGSPAASEALAMIDERFGTSGGGGGMMAGASSGGGATPHAASGATADDAKLREAAQSAQASAGKTMSDDDVAAMLAEKADKSGEDLDWQNSVVDLLKLLGKDTSVGSRRKYMAALGVDGEAGSSEGNEALHAALLGQLADNGGKLPSNVA